MASTQFVSNATVDVLNAIGRERNAQDAKWGEQNHPDGTGQGWHSQAASAARKACDLAFRSGRGTWRHILLEEYAEAMAESDPAKLREELIQVAAVAAAWVEAIDRRS